MIWQTILNLLKSYWYLVVILLIVTIIIVRVKARGFFWEDKYGNQLSLKEFLGRWRKGIEGISPVQQSLTSLWGFPLILGGMMTGIVINIINHVWWLVIILIGGFPPTLMSLVSLWQKYQSQKKAQEAYNEAMGQVNHGGEDNVLP
jgi:hypothetical protein